MKIVRIYAEDDKELLKDFKQGSDTIEWWERCVIFK